MFLKEHELEAKDPMVFVFSTAKHVHHTEIDEKCRRKYTWR